jgi:hypothetical protein
MTAWRRLRLNANPSRAWIRVGARRAAATCVGAALVLTPSSPARAQSAADVAAARDLFIEGSRLSNAGDWAHAQDHFERSLRLKRAPITLFSLAVVETHTGHLVEALEHFRAFLAEPSAAATRAYEDPATAAVAELDHRVGRCVFAVSPPNLPDLAVTIDGEPVPTVALDVARVVNPGAHAVAASARGWLGASARCTVGEGATARVELVLTPVAATPATAVVGDSRPSPLAPRADAAPESPSRALPFSLIGGGGALLVAGIAVGLVGVQQAANAPTRNGPAADSARTKGIAGDVLGSVGVAAAAVGVVILVVQATRKPSSAPSAWVRPAAQGIAVAF